MKLYKHCVLHHSKNIFSLFKSSQIFNVQIYDFILN
jgi:hypothetical protein